jgi:putative chitinase
MVKITKKDLEILKLPLAIPALPYLNSAFELGKINTFNRIAFLMANLMHESGDFRYLREIHDGSNYEFRVSLGNIQKGDGKRFSGKSYLQITGRNNYRAFTKWSNSKGIMIDFVEKPELLETYQYSVIPAIFFWEVNKLEKYADAGDFLNVCSIINTGRVQDPKRPHTINGYEDRLKKLDRVVAWLKNILT